MKPSLLHKIFSLTYFLKATSYKKGVLIVMSFPISIGIIDIFKIFFSNVTMHDLVLPIVSISACIALYTLFWIFDFITGIRASRKVDKPKDEDWIKSDKLYNSFAKIIGIILANVLFLVILLFLVAAKLGTVSMGFLILFVSINILVTLFEFQSIGENIKMRTGVKPGIYQLFDNISDAMEVAIIERIKKLLSK